MAGKRNIVRFVAISCRHHPLADSDAMSWACDQIRDVQPDYVIDLGDRYEADSASRWPSEYDWELEDEYRHANGWDAAIRDAAGDAELVFLPGNHDNNLLDLHRLDRGVRGLCDWRRPQYAENGERVNGELIDHWKVGARYLNCKSAGCYRLGQVTFHHGYPAGSQPDRNLAVRFGTPFGLTVSGHTHTPLQVEQARLTKKIPLPFWFANAGCLRDLKPHYAEQRNTDEWGHGCVVGEADLRAGPAKSPRMTRRWSAETRVRKRYAGAESEAIPLWSLGSEDRKGVHQ